MKIKIALGFNLILLCCLFVIMARGAEIVVSYEPIEEIIEQIAISREEPDPVNYALIKEKALFHRTRSKIEEVIEKIEEIEKVREFPISSLTLKGVVFQDDSESVAYLINNRSNEEYGLKVNEMIEGWKVTEINRNYINLENGGQLFQLHLLNE